MKNIARRTRCPVRHPPPLRRGHRALRRRRREGRGVGDLLRDVHDDGGDVDAAHGQQVDVLPHPGRPRSEDRKRTRSAGSWTKGSWGTRLPGAWSAGRAREKGKSPTAGDELQRVFFRMKMVGKTGQTMTMNTKLAGRYLGPCPKGRKSGPTGETVKPAVGRGDSDRDDSAKDEEETCSSGENGILKAPVKGIRNLLRLLTDPDAGAGRDPPPPFRSDHPRSEVNSLTVRCSSCLTALTIRSRWPGGNTSRERAWNFSSTRSHPTGRVWNPS